MLKPNPIIRAAVITVALYSAVLILPPSMAHAVPAMPMGFELSQPGGAGFNARKMGDEFQGWTETEDGYTVVMDAKSGRWEYAVPDASGNLHPSGHAVIPGKRPPKGVVPGVRPPRNSELERSVRDSMRGGGSQAGEDSSKVYQSPSYGPAGSSETVYLSGGNNWDPVPVSGDINVLIILVGFADRALITTPDDWNPTTFQTTGNADSLKNYYLDNSFNTLNMVPLPHAQSGSPDGIIEVNLPTNHPNYGGTTTYGAEAPWMNAALAEAAAFVNFSALDTSGDGIFQNSELVVYFVAAGYETSGSGKTPSIWAHYMYSYTGLNADGVKIREWAVNGELNHYEHLHPMGVMAHELGHLMCGLPDLYDTSSVNKGMGGYSIMAYGSWGRRISDTLDPGILPVSLDAWSRQYLGWSSPRTPASPGTLSFPAALSAADAPVKLVNNGVSPTEYYLIENRYNTGWDLGMEGWIGTNWGGGLLVQHIDITVGTPGYNDINRYETDGRQGVLVVEANTSSGSLMDNTANARKEHLFYSGNKDSFTSTSTPDNLLYDGTDPGFSLTSISSKSSNMTAYADSQLSSVITSPQDGTIVTGLSQTISGTATSGFGPSVSLVEVSVDGGPWEAATGTTGWTFDWTAPRPGSYTITSRATDTDTNTEVPGPGVTVFVKAAGDPELTHYGWDGWLTGGDCAGCHHSAGTFLQSGYRESGGFCRSCHNPAATAHERGALGSMIHSSPALMSNPSAADLRTPSYGNFTSGELDNRPGENLYLGDEVVCVTCHNVMQKPEDIARTWELTATSDGLTYALENGGWQEYGFMQPKVYRDSGLISAPTLVKDRKPYLVDASEYTFDMYSGTVTFSQDQGSDYIYVTLDYPSLRASNVGNRLCSDCHSYDTHMGENCLTCHTAHGTANIKLIRENIDSYPVEFRNHTGTVGSFSNMSGTAHGPCEACHTQTLYHRQDRTGQPHHDGEDCTTCHGHATGFPK